MKRIFVAVLVCLLAAPPLFAASPAGGVASKPLTAAPAPEPRIAISLGADGAHANITVLGLGVDLALRFESVDQLSVANLGLSARLATPADYARLPGTGLVNVPLALPVVVTVEPPAAGGLAFRNAVEVELHTHVLPYAVDSPLRLFKAPLGGAFRDITAGVDEGSVRCRGRTGGFSEFMIVVDLTPPAQALDAQLDALDARVATAPMPAELRYTLTAQLAELRAAAAAADFAGAQLAREAFVASVRAAAGAGLADRWRAARDLENHAGELLGHAESVAFYLGRLD